MMNSILSEIDPVNIANEVRLERSGNRTPVLIVEGPSDSLIFKRLLNDEQWSFVVSFGKDKALQAIDILKQDERVKGYSAIVDLDFDYLKDEIRDSCVIYTDFFDLEIMMIESEAFSIICEECITVEKFHKIENYGSNIREQIYRLLVFYSACRFSHSINEAPAKFDDINLDHIQTKTMSIDTARLKRQVGAKYGDNSLMEKVIGGAEELLKTAIDPKMMVRGRDFLCVFSKALESSFRSKSAPKADAKTIEKMLRAAYTREMFRTTALAYNIRLWRDSLFEAL